MVGQTNTQETARDPLIRISVVDTCSGDSYFYFNDNDGVRDERYKTNLSG